MGKFRSKRGQFTTKKTFEKYEKVSVGRRKYYSDQKHYDIKKTVNLDHSYNNQLPVHISDLQEVIIQNEVGEDGDAKLTVPREPESWRHGRRVIELGLLFDQMATGCKKCSMPLPPHCVGERRYALSQMIPSVISKVTANRIAGSGLRLCHLQMIVRREGKQGRENVLGELVGESRAVRVTKSKKIIQSLYDYVKNL